LSKLYTKQPDVYATGNHSERVFWRAFDSSVASFHPVGFYPHVLALYNYSVGLLRLKSVCWPGVTLAVNSHHSEQRFVANGSHLLYGVDL